MTRSALSRSLRLALALTAPALVAGCTAGDRPAGPHDGGPVDAGHDAGAPRPDLGRECAYHDGGDVDLGPIPDLGPLTPPDLSVPPPDLGPPTATTVNGCPSLAACLGSVGEDAGLTYDGFATNVFTTYCTRCHATTLTDAARSGAPAGYDWDDRASVYAHLPEIRDVIGVSNYMPFSRPADVPCSVRRQMVLWIDTGAP